MTEVIYYHRMLAYIRDPVEDFAMCDTQNMSIVGFPRIITCIISDLRQQGGRSDFGRQRKSQRRINSVRVQAYDFDFIPTHFSVASLFATAYNKHMNPSIVKYKFDTVEQSMFECAVHAIGRYIYIYVLCL